MFSTFAILSGREVALSIYTERIKQEQSTKLDVYNQGMKEAAQICLLATDSFLNELDGQISIDQKLADDPNPVMNREYWREYWRGNVAAFRAVLTAMVDYDTVVVDTTSK